ncbi:THUMP domain-containing class I SAM-dependent methyltransferase [Tengunoibacter tsumagoiensis]|uniref:RNA methyltransferase n=1 Tax=Tengunoibacter tsumagoiensis TaxID=2014871 RepID=A0A401ZY55_9CHLR|nr:methyltransferase domain-containing protein [Tengunoibacter tsumagoiensis]GCE11786.1 RNA methyltransferase [Tengunoibacter tsumagoiensis]
MSQLFYCMTMPGLETLAFSEIREHLPDAEQVKFARGIAVFKTAHSPAALLELRTVEDVFASAVHIPHMRRDPDGLRVLHSATMHTDLTPAITSWRRAHHGRQPRTWRVVSQMVGSYDFRRNDAGLSLANALKRVLPRGMRQVDDDADMEIWLWLGNNDVLIGVRLSDATMRHRSYKREHLPASLRPTVAAAMNWLARPTAQDVVLDPLCGAGTILVERGLMAPFDRLIGGDIRDEAVAMARRNARSADVGVSWRVWDAQELPLEPASVTRIITNLPFGKQLGSHQSNIDLYSALIKEFERVLTPDGLLVALTSEDRLWSTLLQKHGWRLLKKVVLVVLGQPASIFVAERADQVVETASR